MIKIAIPVLFIFGLLLSSCSDEKTTEVVPLPQPERYYSIVGEWEWTGSGGGWNGDTYTNPDSVGKNLFITFIRNGNAIFVEDCDTIMESGYNIKTENWWGKDMDILYFYDPEPYYIGYFIIDPGFNDYFLIFRITDTLIISDDCCDGFTHGFRRITE